MGLDVDVDFILGLAAPVWGMRVRNCVFRARKTRRRSRLYHALTTLHLSLMALTMAYAWEYGNNNRQSFESVVV